MTNQIKNTLFVFGTGNGGNNCFQHFKNTCEVLGFLDNDPKKQGSLFNGLPVYAPSELSNHPNTDVAIGSMYVESIRGQLVNELKINPERIHIPSKRILKGQGAYPFECPATYNFALNLLLEICELFENKKLPYFIDHGTLLGLVRDNGLIPWDDDIDLTTPPEYLPSCVKALDEWLLAKPVLKDYLLEKKMSANEKGEPVSYSIACESLLHNHEFDICLKSFRIQDDKAIQQLTVSDKIYFEKNDTFLFQGLLLSVPHRYSDYLTDHYGDWKTPKKEMRFGDCANYIDQTISTKENQ